MGKLPGTWQGGRQGEALLTLGSLAKPESILRKHQETPLAGRGGPWVGGGEAGGRRVEECHIPGVRAVPTQ